MFLVAAFAHNTAAYTKSSPLEHEDYVNLLWAYSQEFGSDIKTLERVVRCESSWKHEGVYGDSGKAYGYGQFHRPTFMAFAHEMGEPDLQYKNPKHQLRVMAWAFAQGEKYRRHWTCYRNIKQPT